MRYISIMRARLKDQLFNWNDQWINRQQNWGNTTINHLQIDNLHLVYIIIDYVEKFRVLICFSFRVCIYQNKQHICASTTITLFSMIVACLQPFLLQIATQIQSISSRIDSAAGCCVVLPPPIGHRPSINSNWTDDVWPLLPFIFLWCSSLTLHIRKQVDCYVIEVLLVQQQLHPSPAHHLCTSRQMCTTCAEPSDHFRGCDG
jgi:hypothetical protein